MHSPSQAPHRLRRQLPAVRVHGGQEVDARGGEEVEDVLVPGAPALTQVVGQSQQQLAPHHLVAVHVGHVLELRLHCEMTWNIRIRKGARE